MKKIGCIYTITNKLNGKQYVGQTINFKERKRNHLKSNKLDRHLYNAFKKYGKENFIFEEFISVIDNYNNLYSLEIETIKILNTYGLNGYNETYGGEGTIGYKPSEITINKLKKARIGRKPSLGMKHTEETKNNYKLNRSKGKHNLYGKKHKKESNIKNLLSQKTRKEILCLNNNVIYHSMRQASKELNIDYSQIQGIISGKYKTAKGYKFSEVI